jgi:hypothetical protein
MAVDSDTASRRVSRLRALTSHPQKARDEPPRLPNGVSSGPDFMAEAATSTSQAIRLTLAPLVMGPVHLLLESVHDPEHPVEGDRDEEQVLRETRQAAPTGSGPASRQAT